jgi:hypothetical protein
MSVVQARGSFIRPLGFICKGVYHEDPKEVFQ